MIRKVLRTALISLGITAFVPFGLIASQSPQGVLATGKTLDFTQILARNPAEAPASTPAAHSVLMRDGYGLQVRSFDTGPGPLIILLHGSGWNGLQFMELAPRLAGNVVVPDLRGHGALPGRRGDVNYIGQLEDDLADLITAKAKPGQQVVLLGHSSGGGLAVRFAGGEHGNLVDKAVLLAPFIKYDAATVRPNSGGWARPLTRRLIGLTMLNGVGISALNHLTAIEFNMPQAVLEGPLGDLATTSYSYRMNRSFSPRADYGRDVAALPEFLLVVGSEDEAFVAEAFEPVMQALTDKGSYKTIAGVGHLDLVDNAATLKAIKGFLDDL